MQKFLFVTAVILLSHANVLADAPGRASKHKPATAQAPPPPPPQQPYYPPPAQPYSQMQPPQYQYPAPQPPYGQSTYAEHQYHQYHYQAHQFNPEQNYICCPPYCNPPALPYSHQLRAYPAPTPGYYQIPPPLVVGQSPWGGAAPGPNHGPGDYHRRHPQYFRPVAAHGCELAQRNNGMYELLSSSGEVLYRDSSAHALPNARAMKSYYESASSHSNLCSDGFNRPATDISL